jgi:hypothetical protein
MSCTRTVNVAEKWLAELTANPDFLALVALGLRLLQTSPTEGDVQEAVFVRQCRLRLGILVGSP